MRFDIKVTGEGILTGVALVAVTIAFLYLVMTLQLDAEAFYKACVESGGYLPREEVCIR